MSTSLSNLTDKLSEIKKNKNHACKKRENIWVNCKYINHEDNRLIYKRKKCNNILYKSTDALKEKFPNIYRFCNKNNYKFFLLLRKGVYPYQYMNNWERFDETKLPDKKIILQQIKFRRYH